eukprot:CAMPEP_0201567310 /NCGR_PEP_ID=MMETSP0190_2-20130828/7768_1 /ASSEMBLY_ACC=CAM_ASM_000263 /TAXON_ID=37353 /ORGANISM="Rosalina sp." /LENGTH=106 /DNA_ID=CAMNT_0047987157 /DNA_START=215 /DNA_END=535 /DNA_ORIENTATION=+
MAAIQSIQSIRSNNHYTESIDGVDPNFIAHMNDSSHYVINEDMTDAELMALAPTESDDESDYDFEDQQQEQLSIDPSNNPSNDSNPTQQQSLTDIEIQRLLQKHFG